MATQELGTISVFASRSALASSRGFLPRPLSKGPNNSITLELCVSAADEANECQ